MTWWPLGPPVMCEQQVDVCLYNLFYNLTHSLNEQMTPPIACSITALIDICEPIYHVSHALRIFLADAPGATLCTLNRYPTNLTFLALETASSVMAWVTYYILNSIFLTNMSLCASRVYNNFGHHILSLYVTCVIFVIWVDEVIISINLSNQTRALPPGPDYSKIRKPWECCEMRSTPATPVSYIIKFIY